MEEFVCKRQTNAGAPDVQEITNITIIMCGLHAFVNAEHQHENFASSLVPAAMEHRPDLNTAGLQIVPHSLHEMP
eukprot:12412334-Karenia_brevis.AAC.1